MPPEVRRRWGNFANRSKRLPDVAAGDFFEMFEAVASDTADALYVALPQELDPREKMSCIRDYQVGRSHIRGVLTLKLGYALGAQFVLFGCAHHSRAVATRILEVCLAVDENRCTHKLFRRLHEPTLKEQAERYIVGDSLDDLPELDQFFWIIAVLAGLANARWSAGTLLHLEAIDKYEMCLKPLEKPIASLLVIVLWGKLWWGIFSNLVQASRSALRTSAEMSWIEAW